ncbi:MAG: ABC transporter ATP-binding protein [Spirochaetales bacterium]|nr:ABC transporter ATP-binding protein [Spirochaetales bacterium]
MDNLILLDTITFHYPDMEGPVFENLSLSLPAGITSLLGQNGTGKSTLLLLAGGTLVPEKGRVLIQGIDTRDLRDERERQRYVSFIYQNLEFESEEPVEKLLHFVYENGYLETREDDFIKRLIDVFELSSTLKKKTQETSKGEFQRVLLAFSLLYGSKIIMMDEPVFALEQYQKIKALTFICEYARKNNISVFYSAHELELTEKFSDYLILIDKKRNIRLGPTQELFTKEHLEEAYQIPYGMLKTKESVYRTLLDKGVYPEQKK